MGNWNLGSVADKIYNRVDNIPVGVSGELPGIVDEQIRFMEEYTGDSIGSTSIATKYQAPLIDLAMASTLRTMSVQGADTSNVRLGEFSISKGSSSNTSTTADMLEKMALKKLAYLGTKIRFYKALG